MGDGHGLTYHAQRAIGRGSKEGAGASETKRGMGALLMEGPTLRPSALGADGKMGTHKALIFGPSLGTPPVSVTPARKLVRKRGVEARTCAHLARDARRDASAGLLSCTSSAAAR